MAGISGAGRTATFGKRHDQRKRFEFSLMARWIALILALGIIAVVLTPSDAWRRRRRRRRRCSVRHCSVSSWSSWSSCTRPCGWGSTTRARRITVSQSCGGGCPYHLRETKRCNTHCCPVDCDYSWNAWSKCTGCGMSSQSRTPHIRRQSSCNGRACPAKQTRSCGV